ncbi:uncharacterized protein [Venturia canescens]|uniref:uncharacterized protein n=1 Tax=Venturia canescens TaxID=32260 RepID=UPI001C9C9784|nr:uncharacterized protein LOC122419118 [Venturia canescens]
MRCDSFFWRRRCLFVVLLLVSTIVLIVGSKYYAQPIKMLDDYEAGFSNERYHEVLQRWYNFSGASDEWYNNKSISMFDEELLMVIRHKWIVNNATLSDSYNLKNPDILDPSMGQAREIMKALDNKNRGFFIECGAYDGETRSNTLVLERFLGWSGILIEADPINFSMMLDKKRKAYLSPTCLSIKPYPMKASFLMARNIGRIHEHDESQTEKLPNTMDVAHSGKHITVQCFPLVSYVAALGIETVDYLSLDIEGNEMEVLETIPFDRIDIRTLSVEHIHGRVGRKQMIEFMEKRGYYVYSFVERDDNLANDIIFVKKQS